MDVISRTKTQPSNESQTRPRPRRTSKRRVNALLFLTEKFGPDFLPYLLQNPDLNLRVISESSRDEYKRYMLDDISLDHVDWFENSPQHPDRTHTKLQGHQLARWADLLFIVMDAGMIALMLTGYTTDVTLHVLRCWDTSKTVIMLPELSIDQWKHPIWSKQLSKLQRKWDWVHILAPALWDYVAGSLSQISNEDPDIVWDWQGPEEIIEAIHSEAQTILRTTQSASSPIKFFNSLRCPPSKPSLPSEIWTLILDYHGDWELATALGIYTHLPVPYEWLNLTPRPGRPKSLEYTILTQPTPMVKKYFESLKSPPTTLSPLATKIVFKHSLTNLLTYLAMHQKDIFYPSFGLALLPHKASLIYNSPAILQWWKSCPAVIKKEYGSEALDGASRAGFVDVLDWWLNSGLRLSYTEKALESASAKDHVQVLEWWKRASEKKARNGDELPLKVGKSIVLAAQSGRVNSLRWWHDSGIPFGHEEGVARLASMHGHVNVLEVWCELKGSKMIFDNQVLVGATKNGHAGVLEWWKKASREYGFVVEYKTCDIEEAMEDAVGGGGEGEVRDWWARNGLNLGVGTGEWMRVKTL